MYVYVANHTQQNRHFHYRVPENQSIRQIELRPGTQARLVDDFNEGGIASILEQLRVAGAVPANDPKALSTAFGLIYSVGDKPIKSNQIDAAREQDVSVRQEIAGDKVTAAGEALHSVASRGAQGGVQSTSLEVTQLTDRDVDAQPVKGGVNAKIEVSRTAPARQRQTSRRRD